MKTLLRCEPLAFAPRGRRQVPQTLLTLAMALSVSAAGVRCGGAASQATSETETPAIAEVRQAARDYLSALQSAEGEAIAACWTPTGVYVDARGRSHAAQQLAREQFATRGDASPEESGARPETSIRMLTPRTALEETTASGGSDAHAGAATNTGFVAIWVKQSNGWRLEYLREFLTPVEAPAESQAASLADLEWMIGEWESAGAPRAKLRVTATDDGRYLRQDFELELPEEQPLRGVQRIAEDPSTGKLRSWIFRSDGGFMEGSWEKAGEAWLVRQQGVLPDGATTTTMSFWLHEPPNACWFKTFRGQIGDETVAPRVLEFRRVQAPAKPGDNGKAR